MGCGVVVLPLDAKVIVLLVEEEVWRSLEMVDVFSALSVPEPELLTGDRMKLLELLKEMRGRPGVVDNSVVGDVVVGDVFVDDVFVDDVVGDNVMDNTVVVLVLDIGSADRRTNRTVQGEGDVTTRDGRFWISVVGGIEEAVGRRAGNEAGAGSAGCARVILISTFRLGLPGYPGLRDRRLARLRTSITYLASRKLRFPSLNPVSVGSNSIKACPCFCSVRDGSGNSCVRRSLSQSFGAARSLIARLRDASSFQTKQSQFRKYYNVETHVASGAGWARVEAKTAMKSMAMERYATK